MNRSAGFLHWVFPAMLGLGALAFLLSGRDFTQIVGELDLGAEPLRHPAVVWSQRATSILLLGVALERVFSHITLRKSVPSLVLAWTFLIYWLGSVAAPALFGSHPQLSHEYIYSLAICLAAVLATTQERDKVLDTSRNALFAFLLAGVLLIPLTPALVLDTEYTQGVVPGVPRLAGLAAHPVELGMLAQTALLLLLHRSFASTWLNGLSWVLGASALVLAQSKSAWIAFFICMTCILAVRHGNSFWRRLGDPKHQSFGISICLGFIAVVLALLAGILLADLPTEVGEFFDTTEGAQLLSLTGRDRIWAIAMEEWRANPLFGYGPGLWDPAFRASIGMPHATHAHNQFMDMLARSGSVGAGALVLYAGVLLVLAVRYAKDTGGLSLALFLALALRSITEVPLYLFSYGTDLFIHLLLIVTLASAAGARRYVAPVRDRATFGMAP